MKLNWSSAVRMDWIKEIEKKKEDWSNLIMSGRGKRLRKSEAESSLWEPEKWNQWKWVRIIILKRRRERERVTRVVGEISSCFKELLGRLFVHFCDRASELCKHQQHWLLLNQEEEERVEKAAWRGNICSTCNASHSQVPTANTCYKTSNCKFLQITNYSVHPKL